MLFSPGKRTNLHMLLIFSIMGNLLVQFLILGEVVENDGLIEKIAFYIMIAVIVFWFAALTKDFIDSRDTEGKNETT